jgi:KTSC domain
MPVVQSILIEAVAYDETARLLRAKFRKGGRIVVYENVPPEIYDSLMFADSVGTYLHDHIEGIYPAREIGPERTQ